MKRDHQNDYLQHLLASIEKKCVFGINNAHKTDLYTDKELLSILSWFHELIRLARESPPDGYVRVVNMIASKDGRLVSVQYELHKGNEKTEEIELQWNYE